MGDKKKKHKGKSEGKRITKKFNPESFLIDDPLEIIRRLRKEAKNKED